MTAHSDLPARIRLFLDAGITASNRETGRALLTLARRDSLDPALPSHSRAELRHLARRLHQALTPPETIGILTF